MIDYELQRVLQILERNDQNLDRALRALAAEVVGVKAEIQQQQAEQAKKQAEQTLRVVVESMTEITAKTMGDFSSYTNVVVAAGYAAIFAIWAFTKDQIPKTPNAVAALLLIFSALVFSLWHVYQLVLISLYGRQMGAMLQSANPMEVLAEFNKAQQKAQVARLYIWAAVVIACLVSALAGAAVLVWYLAAPLVTDLWAALRPVIFN